MVFGERFSRENPKQENTSGKKVETKLHEDPEHIRRSKLRRLLIGLASAAVLVGGAEAVKYKHQYDQKIKEQSIKEKFERGNHILEHYKMNIEEFKRMELIKEGKDPSIIRYQLEELYNDVRDRNEADSGVVINGYGLTVAELDNYESAKSWDEKFGGNEEVNRFLERLEAKRKMNREKH